MDDMERSDDIMEEAAASQETYKHKMEKRAEAARESVDNGRFVATSYLFTLLFTAVVNYLSPSDVLCIYLRYR